MIFFKNLFNKKEPVEKPEWSKGFSSDPDYYYDWEQLKFKFPFIKYDMDNNLFNGFTPDELNAMLQKANEGDAEAQYHLGVALCPGLSQTENTWESNCNNEYIEKSAKGGYAPAQYLMGLVHIDSEVESEVNESEEWFKRASDQDLTFATLALHKVQCMQLNIEWSDKYSETDSSVVNYEEVNRFSLKVKDMLENIESNYEKNGKTNDTTTNVDDFFAHMSETLLDFLNDLYPRTLIYLKNIEGDNQIRRQISEAVDSALLTHDENTVDTAKRVLEIIKLTSKFDKNREYH